VSEQYDGTEVFILGWIKVVDIPAPAEFFHFLQNFIQNECRNWGVKTDYSRSILLNQLIRTTLQVDSDTATRTDHLYKMIQAYGTSPDKSDRAVVFLTSLCIFYALIIPTCQTLIGIHSARRTSIASSSSSVTGTLTIIFGQASCFLPAK
jgi:hypothetical protein